MLVPPKTNKGARKRGGAQAASLRALVPLKTNMFLAAEFFIDQEALVHVDADGPAEPEGTFRITMAQDNPHVALGLDGGGNLGFLRSAE